MRGSRGARGSCGARGSSSLDRPDFIGELESAIQFLRQGVVVSCDEVMNVSREGRGRSYVLLVFDNIL